MSCLLLQGGLGPVAGIKATCHVMLGSIKVVSTQLEKSRPLVIAIPDNRKVVCSQLEE